MASKLVKPSNPELGYGLRSGLILLGTLFILVGCGPTGQGSDLETLPETERNTVPDIIDIGSSKVSVESATIEQMRDFVGDCNIKGRWNRNVNASVRGNGSAPKRLCAVICHRPPGNPLISRSLLLPLAATKAHLNHGAPDREDDYLGPCRHAGPVDPNDPIDEDDGSLNPTETDGVSLNNEVPNWCKTHHEIDSDCDGFIDASGISLF